MLTNQTITGAWHLPDGTLARDGQIVVTIATSNGTLNDTLGEAVISGEMRYDVQRDGTVTPASLPTLPQTGLMPVGALYEARFHPSANGARDIPLGRFDLTANTTWDALNIVLDVEVTPDLLAQAQAIMDGPIELSQLDLASTTNLFPDPGFERSTSGFVGGVNSTLALSQAGTHGGSQQALRVTANVSGAITPNRSLNQFDTGIPASEDEDGSSVGGLVDLKPNTVYTVSGWAYNATGNGGSGVSIRVNGAGAAGDTTGAVVNTRSAWVLVSNTFTTGSDPSQTIKCFLNSANVSGNVTYWDDISLVEGNTPVTGSGDDDGWAWVGRPRRSPSQSSPVVDILPDYLHQSPLDNAYADRNGLVPSQSGPTTVPGSCQPVASGTETTIASTDPIPCATIAGVLYGFRNFAIYSSADAGRTWTLKKDLGTAGALSGIQDIKLAGDGELLVSRGIWGIWKSSGWATPSTSTWTQKITPTHVADDGVHGAVDGEIVPWAWDVWGAYVVATEYQGDGSYRPASRKVWLSIDSGSTFTEIYDLNTQSGITAIESHLHIAMIDRYQVVAGVPRLFISHHGYKDGEQYIKFSDNLGATWITLISKTPDAQPTVGIGLPSAVVFGSDGKPDGLLRFSRVDTDGGLSSVPARIWTWRSNAPGLSFICKVAQRVTDTNGNDTALFTFRSRRNGIPGVAVLTDGNRADEVHRWQGTTSQQPLYTWAGVTNGEFVGRVTVPADSVDKLLRGTAPYYGPAKGASVAYDTDGVPYLTF